MIISHPQHSIAQHLLSETFYSIAILCTDYFLRQEVVFCIDGTGTALGATNVEEKNLTLTLGDFIATLKREKRITDKLEKSKVIPLFLYI